MKKLLNVVKLRGVPIHEQLRIEEILLRRSNENWFIFNARSLHVAVVVGYAGKVDELVNIEPVARDSVAIIRRYTGGGTVVVDENTVFTTFIMNESDVPSKPYPRDIMAWSEKDVFGPIFSVKPEHGESPTFSLRENDYVLDSRKIGGNAQSIVRGRWVHHTSFLWDFNAQRMQYLQMPKKRPDYRADRNHLDFLTSLKDHLPSIEDFEHRLVSQLHGNYDVSFTNEEDVKKIVSDLFSTAEEKELKLLVRTRTESVEDHLASFVASKALINPEGTS